MEPTVPTDPVPSDPSLPPLVAIANHSPHRFTGWLRATTDAPPHGEAGDWWRGAGQRGTVHAVDVFVGLLGSATGVALSLRPGADDAPQWPVGEDPLVRYGGPLLLFAGGEPIEPTFVAPPRIERGSIEAHLRARVGSWVADIYLRAHPGEGWVHGELVLSACDPRTLALVHSLPQGLTLRWGDAVIVSPGRGFTVPLVDPLQAGDAQGRAVPFLAVWPRLLGQDVTAWESVQALATWLVVAGEAGAPNLYPQGTPHCVPPLATLPMAREAAVVEPAPVRHAVVERDGILSLDPLTLADTGSTLRELAASALATMPGNAVAAEQVALGWAVAHHDQARDALHTWAHPGLGPNARSGDTGAQEDQCFVRGEVASQVGAIVPSYFAALAMAKRPCQHREADGGPLQDHLHANPRGVMWDSRWHWHTGVSPYQGGKAAAAQDWQFQGLWAGADVEHWLLFGLAAAHRLTGSPALDLLLDTQARIYPHQWTVDGGLSTTQAYASRAIGWECANAMLLHRELHDRGLATQVESHWRHRMREVILPHLQRMRDGNGGVPVWDVRYNDPRLGDGPWWIPWQQAVGCYWMHVAASYFGGMPEAEQVALDGARLVVDRAWRPAGQHWQCAPQAPFGREQDAVFDGSFAYFGMGLAVACALRGGDTGKAGDIAEWLVRQAKPNDLRWLAPDMVAIVHGRLWETQQ